MARKVLTCPRCGSTDIYYAAYYQIGAEYECRRCGYIGPLVVEKEVPDEDGED